MLSYRNRPVSYCAVWPEGGVIETLVERAARDTGLSVEVLPDNMRKRRAGNLEFRFDYRTGDVAWERRP